MLFGGCTDYVATCVHSYRCCVYVNDAILLVLTLLEEVVEHLCPCNLIINKQCTFVPSDCTYIQVCCVHMVLCAGR